MMLQRCIFYAGLVVCSHRRRSAGDERQKKQTAEKIQKVLVPTSPRTHTHKYVYSIPT